MKVKIKWVKEFTTPKGGVCWTKSMVDRSKLPSKKYVELDSLLEWMRYRNRIDNEDNFLEREAVFDFINLVDGCLKEEASPGELEWV